MPINRPCAQSSASAVFANDSKLDITLWCLAISASYISFSCWGCGCITRAQISWNWAIWYSNAQTLPAMFFGSPGLAAVTQVFFRKTWSNSHRGLLSPYISDSSLITATIPRQSRGLSNCEPLKAANRGRSRGPGSWCHLLGNAYLHNPSWSSLSSSLSCSWMYLRISSSSLPTVEIRLWISELCLR